MRIDDKVKCIFGTKKARRVYQKEGENQKAFKGKILTIYNL